MSLLLSFSRKKRWLLVTLILDVLMVALLFSGNGATAAIGVLGYKGNSHVRWNRVCNVFGKFCNQVAAAVALSLLGSIVFILLVMLAALRLHNKSKWNGFTVYVSEAIVLTIHQNQNIINRNLKYEFYHNSIYIYIRIEAFLFCNTRPKTVSSLEPIQGLNLIGLVLIKSKTCP